MVNQIVDSLRRGVSTEQVSVECGLSVSDVEAVRNSPLVRLCLVETTQEEIE